ncbi:hypothetical protein SAMN04487939_10669 [Lysobacter sp. yr284]|uniref:hypothetical protein n=1 Tax=Lysobacter sp. yr284 TaxID=1761791 RepID=UPI0008945F11|nr:hypothetical protein [Lysobacter sp. yr284]SDY78449.1 hypothetical protein SAMN04487939_10669 [Lysobacter sp. yr284]
METFTSLFFAFTGALNFVRYGLWALFPLGTVILLFARLAKSPPDYALSNAVWWASVVFLAVVGSVLALGIAAIGKDRNFAYPVFQLLFVAGPALLACLVSMFLRPPALS